MWVFQSAQFSQYKFLSHCSQSKHQTPPKHKNFDVLGQKDVHKTLKQDPLCKSLTSKMTVD